MQWRVYLDGEERDLTRLRHELDAGDLVVKNDDDPGTYLQMESFEPMVDADEVRRAALSVITILNGISALLSPHSMQISFAGRVVRAGLTDVYLEDSAVVSDTTFVTAAGHVTVTATAGGIVSEGGVAHPPGPSATVARYQEIAQNPVLTQVYRILGSTSTPKWAEFYKIYEILCEAAGGSDKALAQRTGVSQSQLGRLTASSNHPGLSGDDARHAVMKGTPSVNRKLTLDEGRALIDELVRGFTR